MEDYQQKKPQVEPTFTEAEISGAWSRCINDLKVHDEASVKAWKEEIDTLLVFAGLFSGVLTAFSVQSYTLLQPNPSPDAAVQLLAQISAQLGSFTVSMSGGSINSTHPAASIPIPAQPISSSSVRINALWFSSLICSLSAASIGILVKQWLNQYTSGLSSVSSHAARTRQYRNDCIKKWRVHDIVMLLPILLQSALGLFLAGLLELLWTLHPTVASVATVFVAVLGLFQLVTTVLPTFMQGCPYHSPQSLAFYMFIQLCKIPYKFGAGSELRMYTWKDREHAMVGGEMDIFLGLRMLASADLTFMDDAYFDKVIRPCSYSIDWSSNMNRVQWFRDVVDYRTSRFHTGHPDALANLVLDAALKGQDATSGQSDMGGLFFSCLNKASPEWWQAHSAHSQGLLKVAAALYDPSTPYYIDAFRIIVKVRTYGAKDVLVQVEHVAVIMMHIRLCHEQGAVDDFLLAVDVLLHYAADATHISDDSFIRMHSNFVEVLQLLQDVCRFRIKRLEIPSIKPQETKRKNTPEQKPTSSMGKLLELVLPILRVARRNPRVVHRDFLDMLIGFLWGGDPASKPRWTLALLNLTSWDQKTREIFFAELNASRNLFLSSERPDTAPLLVDGAAPVSEMTTLSHTQSQLPQIPPAILPEVSAVCAHIPPRISL